MRLTALLFLLLLNIPAHALDPAPESATGWQSRAGARAERFMVAAANPLAAEAGLGILRQGGGAVDAAIATQMVLNLVEPQSSGIGGGAFLLHWDGAGVAAYDGRETAPAAARPDRFLNERGEPLSFMDAVVGGASVGVPGLLRMLEMAHREHGRLPWATLFQPAIRLAEEGFPVSPRLHALLAGEEHLRQWEPARSLYYQADGTALPVGAVLRNPALAETLRLIAAKGADAFYGGALAERIVATVRDAPRHPGDLTLDDLAGYQARKRDAVCGPYRRWTVCGMPPPSSGGITVLQILGMLERFEMPPPLTPPAAHLFAETGKLAFADRNRYIADADVVDVPTQALLDRDYLRGRARLIDPGKAMDEAKPGDLPQRHGWADDAAPELPSTSHLSIVDGWGNAVAMTSSIENGFGSRLMVGGFLLNNQLTDFSFRPEQDGRPIANAVAPGKRPRSSMAPTLVFDETGALRLVTGSPGGSRIIGFVVRNVVAALDWRLDPLAAAALPHVLNRNGPTELEAGTAAEGLNDALLALGHTVKLTAMTSGLHSIAVTPEGLLGGADPRREGVAVGE